MFYIASQGHSASGWLAKALCMHPKIVCYHGRSNMAPPYVTGVQDQGAIDFLHGLKESEERCFGEKVFGACHGAYQLHVKEGIEELDGQFFSILRDPVNRVNSILMAFSAPDLTAGVLPGDVEFPVYALIEKYESSIDEQFAAFNSKQEMKKGLKNSLDNIGALQYLKTSKMFGVYRQMRESWESMKTIRKRNKMSSGNVDGFTGIDNALTEKEIADSLVTTFVGACIITLSQDADTYRACNEKGILKMEEYVSSPEYFDKNIFQEIMGKSADESYLNHIYQQTGHVNKHSHHGMGRNDIFNKWPKSFREHFMDKWENEGAKDLYEHLEYQKPA